jgi:hypothetical protein
VVFFGFLLEGDSKVGDEPQPSGDGAARRPLFGPLPSFSGPTTRLFAGLTMLAAVALLFAYLLSSIERSRRLYFQEKDLSELDRVARNVSSTSTALDKLAALHFVPAQLRFFYSPSRECLIAETIIPSAMGLQARIVYRFPRPAAPANGHAGTQAAHPADPAPAPDRCTSRETGRDGLAIDPEQVVVVKRLAPRELVNPIAPKMPGGDAFRSAWNELKDKARSELEGLPTSAPSDAPRLLEESFTAAEKSGIVATTSIPAQALDLTTVLQRFDGVRIVGPGARNPSGPAMLLRAGAIPPDIDLDDSASADTFIDAVFADPGQHVRAQPGQSGSGASGARKLTPEARVYRSGNTFIFERSYPQIEGFGCEPTAPCQILGVVTAARFGEDVRKLEGLPLTAFLIAAVTLAALVPLLYLTLLKRLDPISLRAQYLIWFSLTLIAASATIASLTVWGVASSKAESVGYGKLAIERLRDAFEAEVRATLGNLVRVGRMKMTEAEKPKYPAPRTDEAGMPKVASSRDAAVLDTASFFDADGSAVIGRTRFSSSASPAYGTTITDRRYFAAAQQGRFKSMPDACVADGGPVPGQGSRVGVKFIIDRVFARPDGVAKTVFLLPLDPHQQPCLGPPPDPRDAASAASTPASYLVATGYLQTFLAASTPPGFRYAIIDPGRSGDGSDILFATRGSSELSESFAHDVAPSDRRDFARTLDRLHHNPALGSISFPTSYRGDPVVLTLAPLSSHVDWILILIEQRKDPGFALWHAASFGYVTWLLAILLAAAAAAAAHAFSRQGLDRRPGLWLWPRRVLTEFTTPRFTCEAAAREVLGQAAWMRDRHILAVLALGTLAVLAAEGSGRSLAALAAVMAAFASRSYFHGETAPDQAASRRLDRIFVRAAGALAAAAFLVMVTELARPVPWNGAELSPARAVMFFLALAGLVYPLRKAWKAISRAPAPSRPTPARGGRLGWALILATIGALPAAAGYLDSIDHSATLVEERRIERANEHREGLATALAAISFQRKPDLAPIIHDRLQAGVLPGERQADPAGQSCPIGDNDPISPSGWDYSLSGIAVDFFALNLAALNHSDHCKLHFRSGWSVLGSGQAPLLLLGLMLPFALMALAYYHFWRQYFLPAPRSPVVTEPPFKAPLTCSRSEFLESILVPAARGEAPRVPFDTDRNHRHLILGAPADLRDEPQLRALSSAEWIDLLDVAIGKEVAAGGAAHAADASRVVRKVENDARVLIVGNLDVVLQMDDEEATARALAALERLAGQVPPSGGRYLFILAEIEPLDRIALLRARTRESKKDFADWRWARLLEDFSLLVLVPRPTSEPCTVVTEELSAIDTRFARALSKQLEGEWTEENATFEERERMIDYLAEQMGDYYHRLWIASSDEERVLLYHIAWRRHLKLEDGPALRSLLVRGLLVRTPEYRLMNKSFARYVRRIERAAEIRKRATSAENATDSIWPLVRIPIIGLAFALLVLVQLLSPQQVTAAVGLLPAVGALLPALLGTWLRPQGRAA